MARVYKRRNKIYLDYVDMSGKRIRESTTATTISEARALLRQKQSEITKAKLLGVQSVAAVKPKLFSDFLDEEYLPHCEATHSASTYYSDRSLAKIVKGFFGKMSLRSVSPGDIQRYIDQEAGCMLSEDRKIRPATVNRRFMFVSGILAEALRRGYIDRNPARGISQLPEHNDKLRWLTPKEEKRLLSFAPDFLNPIIQAALNSGMRKGELLALKWADVDREQRLVRVSHTKNHKTRYVPINRALRETLEAIPPFIGEEGPSPYVFTNPETGTRFVNIDASFRKTSRDAGLLDVTFHCLRHTFASRLAQAGVPLNTIRELLGHGTMQVTMRYAHLAPSNLHQAVALLSGSRFGGERAQM